MCSKSLSFQIIFCEQRDENEEDLAKIAVDHSKEVGKGKLKNSKDVSEARNRKLKMKIKKANASEKWVVLFRSSLLFSILNPSV